MRILVNAGPTREFIDTVRFISNASSGQMGYAIARQAKQAGHDVVLVSGPVSLTPPDGVRVVRVISADAMFEACRSAFDECEAAVLTAAVCDYRPADPLNHKLKKTAGGRSLRLEPTPDIAAHLGRHKGPRIVVGFALEDRDARRHAEAKLRNKHLDAVALNTPANLAARQATIEILTADGQWSGPIAGTKDEVAVEIVRLVERLAARRR
ncbi:MAG: phosphopantothenoylcysteine decarboxylase [Phycisphaerales bacterium]|nr:MAG: phosphopantothenoylcysteine decarboxylase [Phycisphaerales bacterium]